MSQPGSGLINGIADVLTLVRLGAAGRLILWKLEAKKRRRAAKGAMFLIFLTVLLALCAVFLALMSGAWHLYERGFSPAEALLSVAGGSVLIALISAFIAGKAFKRATRAPRLNDLFPF